MLDLGVLVARATLDTAQFDTGYVRTAAKMRGLSDQALKMAEGFLRLDEALAGTGKAASSAAAGMDRAAKATATTSTAEQKAAASAERHAAALKQVAGIMSTVSGESTKVQSATLRVTAAQERLNTVTESGTATTRQLALAQGNLITAERSLAAAQRTTYASTGHAESGFRRMIGTAAELGLVFGGIEIAKKAIEFVSAGKELTTALNGVQAAARATDAQMVAVGAEAIALGRDMSVPKATAVDAAQAINDLVRAGMKLPRAMVAARPALLLAAAAQVDTADAARYLGDTLDDFALKATQAQHVANSLAGAATSAGGGLTDMFVALSYAGPYARAVGVDVDSVIAAIAELAKSGIQGARAGTGLARMLQQLASPSDKAKKALADLGVQAWDAQGRFVGLTSLFGQLHTAQERMGVDAQRFGKDVTDAFGARAAAAVAVFAHRGVEGYNQFAARVKSGDVQKYANLMNRGVSADMAALGKRFTAAGIAIWDRLEPSARSASHWFAYDLPKAVGVTMQILGPLIHMVGTGLAVAWHVAAGAIGVAAAALGGIGHFLSGHATLVRVVGTAVLGMWAAWKGYRIVTAAMDVMSVALVNGRANVARWRAGFTESLTGVQAQTATTAAVMDAEFAQIGAAALEAAAAQDKAAAQEAAAYADMVAASDNATATMVANAAAQAVAAQTAATESAAAAAEAATSAETSSAAIATAGEEASIGWAGLAGPIGLAVGALAMVGIGFMHSGGDAAAAAAQVQTFTDAIKADSGALADNTRQAVVNALEKQGALEAGLKLGIDTHTLTDATLGHAGALHTVNAALAEARTKLEANHTAVSSAHVYIKGAIDDGTALGTAYKTVSGAVGDTTGELHSAVAAYRRTDSAMTTTAASGRALAGTMSATTTSSMSLTGAMRVAATAADRQKEAEQQLKATTLGLKGALGALAGILDRAAAAVAFQQGLQDLTKTMKDNKGALAGNSAAAVTDRASFISLAQQIRQNADTMAAHGASVQKVTGYLRDHVAQLRAAAIKAGADKTAVDNLTTSLHLFPAQIRSEIYLNTDNALAKLRYLSGQIDSLNHGIAVSGAAATTAGSMAYTGPEAPPKKKPGHADGGLLRGRGTGTSDSMDIKASNGEYVVNARQTARNLPLLEAINAGAPGFARGGRVGGTVRSQVMSQIRDPRVRLAMLMAPFLEGGGRTPLGSGGWGVGDNGHSFGPYQINLPYHPGVTAGKATNPAFAVRYMSGAYRAAARSVPDAMWRDSPAMAARLAIFRAERPSRIYGASAAAAAFRAVGGVGATQVGGGGGGGGGGSVVSTLPGAGGNPPIQQRLSGGGVTGGTQIDRVPMAIYRVGKGFGWNGNYYGSHKDAVSARRDALEQAAAQRLAPGYHQGRRTPTTITDRIGGPHGATGVAKILAANRPTAVKAMRDLAKAVNAAWDLKGVEKSIDQARTQLNGIRGALAGMRQYQSGVASTYAGNFDPTQYGSIGGLIGGLHGATAADSRIARQIARLRREHLNKGWLNQLVTGNQTGLIGMLAGGSQGDINRVNAALGDWRGSLTSIGQAATLNQYGRSIAAEQRLVARQQTHIGHLIDQMQRTNRRIDGLVGAVAGLTGRPVEVTLDGKVIARSTGAHHARAITHRGRRGGQTG